MAIVGDTFTTYEAIGNREDLIDVITNIAPIDTYFTSNSQSTRAIARLHEFQTDTLAAAAENAQIEGDQFANTAVVPTERLNNYTQILRKVFQITDTQEAVSKAGRDSEMSYQTQKNLKELARDIEYALLINSASASGTSGVARKMKGAEGWITTNVTTGTGTGTEALTETMLNDNLQAIWSEGGFPATILCGSFQKRAIDGFATETREVGLASSEGQIQAAVDVYKSSFGTLAVRLHHQVNTTIPDEIIILGDMNLWHKSWLRPIKVQKTARTADADQFAITAELTLESRQEAGSGKITGLTTS